MTNCQQLPLAVNLSVIQACLPVQAIIRGLPAYLGRAIGYGLGCTTDLARDGAAYLRCAKTRPFVYGPSPPPCLGRSRDLGAASQPRRLFGTGIPPAESSAKATQDGHCLAATARCMEPNGKNTRQQQDNKLHIVWDEGENPHQQYVQTPARQSARRSRQPSDGSSPKSFHASLQCSTKTRRSSTVSHTPTENVQHVKDSAVLCPLTAAYMCLFMCSERWSLLEKALSQRAHWNGRSPVCLR